MSETLRRPVDLRVWTDPFRDLRPTQEQFRDFDQYVISRQRKWRRRLTRLQRFALKLQRFGIWV